MFSKALAVVIAISATVHAHAGVTPALGVQGQLTRADVQRPSAQKPCGNANINGLASSTPVQAAVDGTFSATAINFNGGKDGSREFTATVDTTGAGTSFNGQVQMITNGDAAPQGTGTQPLVGKLPTGAQCAGGANGNLCLVSFKSAAGFGNCVVVAQGGGGGVAGGTAGAAGAANGNNGAQGATGGAANKGAKGAAGGTANGTANTGAQGGGAANKGAKGAANGAANNGAQGATNNGAQGAAGGAANTGAQGATGGAANKGAKGAAGGRGRGRGRKAQKGQQAPAPAAQGGTRAPRFARYVAESEQ
ncbi:hypothetical protein E1B28_006064 [Marasmius oreades]|uniref:Uncharacterized protein n=1 Tax=Marasmius oreades TaxID=181124 RepID=A0A9P7UUW4_9AGAR|nr:uncharacterized protein E1B28_006064 [Marasmius oreades]KAG7095297.1 hypothetical protein E1B28_006064 [Marasmius oreades]